MGGVAWPTPTKLDCSQSTNFDSLSNQARNLQNETEPRNVFAMLWALFDNTSGTEKSQSGTSKQIVNKKSPFRIRTPQSEISNFAQPKIKMASGKGNPDETERPTPSPHANFRRPLIATYEEIEENGEGYVQILQVQQFQPNKNGFIQDITENLTQKIDSLLLRTQRLIRSRKPAFEKAAKTYNDNRKEMLELQMQIKDEIEYRCKDDKELEEKNAMILKKVNKLADMTNKALKELADCMEFDQPNQSGTIHELGVIARDLSGLKDGLNHRGQFGQN